MIEHLALRDLDRVVLTTVPLQVEVLDREHEAMHHHDAHISTHGAARHAHKERVK
jgi:hypothetical protein